MGLNAYAPKDSEGRLVVAPGMVLGEYYVVQEVVGSGSFGAVVRAATLSHDPTVLAIKISRNIPEFLHQAAHEVRVLSYLQKKDQTGVVPFVRMLATFMHEGHHCIVFEHLSRNLYELLRSTRLTGVSLGLVRRFASQILDVLAFLQSPEVGVIHTDLKPENLMLQHLGRSGIKVIDFGSSLFLSETLGRNVQSRYYRAPEVLLGLQYDGRIDLWSLGCILCEMHTGTPLFPGRDDSHMLELMSQMLGPFPENMLSQSRRLARVQSASMKHPRHDDAFVHSLELADHLGVFSCGPEGRREGQPGHSIRDYVLFLDFIVRILQPVYQRRSSLAELHRHPFVDYSTSGARALEVLSDPDAVLLQRYRSLHGVPELLIDRYFLAYLKDAHLRLCREFGLKSLLTEPDELAIENRVLVRSPVYHLTSRSASGLAVRSPSNFGNRSQ